MEFKVVVLGDKGVGKTSLVLRFIEGYFIAKQQSTIGMFIVFKSMKFFKSLLLHLLVQEHSS